MHVCVCVYVFSRVLDFVKQPQAEIMCMNSHVNLWILMLFTMCHYVPDTHCEFTVTSSYYREQIE